jgi:hypothetical protein
MWTPSVTPGGNLILTGPDGQGGVLDAAPTSGAGPSQPSLLETAVDWIRARTTPRSTSTAAAVVGVNAGLNPMPSRASPLDGGAPVLFFGDDNTDGSDGVAPGSDSPVDFGDTPAPADTGSAAPADDGSTGPADDGSTAPADTPSTAPTNTVGPSSPLGSSSSISPLAASLNRGFQYLIGLSFGDAVHALSGAGAKGLAIVDPEGATRSAITGLHNDHGTTLIAYNNAFQAQPDEKIPAGVRTIGSDAQWGEKIPDYTNVIWQNRRIDQATAAAKNGFAGIMVDNVPVAGKDPKAADFIARMIKTAREASGNASFSAILQNGEVLVLANPVLVDQGLVGALQKEDVSYRVRGAGTGTGEAVDADERADTQANFAKIRARHPNLPLISVDYPANNDQAAQALARSRAFGFNVAHVAIGDGDLMRISTKTQVLKPAPERDPST